MSQTLVRLAKPADAAYVSRDGYTDEKANLRKINAEEVFLLLVENEPAGYLKLEFLWSNVPYIGLIWIDEPYRKCGFSRDLLGVAESHLRERGYNTLYSSSQVDEPEPQAWHRHIGFMECGVINGINPGGIGEVFFRKNL